MILPPCPGTCPPTPTTLPLHPTWNVGECVHERCALARAWGWMACSCVCLSPLPSADPHSHSWSLLYRPVLLASHIPSILPFLCIPSVGGPHLARLPRATYCPGAGFCPFLTTGTLPSLTGPFLLGKLLDSTGQAHCTYPFSAPSPEDPNSGPPHST